jgi:signal transduction histidine kinase
VRLYAPIAGDDQEVRAVLIGVIDENLFPGSLYDETIPHQQKIYLVDTSKVMIACGPIGDSVSVRQVPIALVEAVERGQVIVDQYTGENGVETFGALSWIGPLGLGILAERDVAEALGPLDHWRIIVGSAFVVVIGFGLAMSIILGNRMIRHLQARERELRNMHEQLITADRLASVGMMAASIAHEVNNPLTTMKVLVHSIHDRVRDRADLHEDLHVVREEIDKIKALVLRFLQFARPRDPEFAAVDLNEILRRVVALIRPQALTRRLTVTEGYEEQLPSIWADGAQLGQVFLNILFNAIEAASDFGEIRVSSKSNDRGTVTATIWNSGEGLAPALAEQVFDPFFSTKATGTGLGLPIARIIIDKHHGSIRAVGHGERGTSFFVTLPRAVSGGRHAPRVSG